MYILILLLMLVCIGMYHASNRLKYDYNQRKTCPPHKWTVKDNGDEQYYMVCLKCSALPGPDHLKEESDET